MVALGCIIVWLAACYPGEQICLNFNRFENIAINLIEK